MKKNYILLRRLLLLVIVGICTTFAQSQTSISDAAGLAAIANNLSGSYVLTTDITLTSTWTPIGTFTGTLDGGGHIIYGLKVNDSGTAQRGLFSQTNGATIRNLGIENANIVGNERTGAIVGLMIGGLIEKCYVANSYIEGRDHVGSIGGQIKGGAIIQNCYSTANIYSREYQAGGLVGVINENNTKISKSYFSGIVRCAANSRPAGIVAWRDNGTNTVEYCVNLAPYILGNDNLRVVGNDGVTLTENYSLANCKLSSDINNYNGSTVPTNDGNYGANKRHGANIPEGDANALTSGFYATTLGWDFTAGTGVWKMLGAGYPVLQWQSAPVNSSALRLASSYSLQNGNQINLNDLVSNRGLVLSFSTTSDKITIAGNIATAHDINTPEDAIISISVNSDFTETDQLIIHLFPTGPITISTPAELNAVTQFPSMSFKLTADLDMTGVAFSGLCSSSTPFTGVFDGNGHVIKGLSYNNTATNTLALINATNGATIKNLGIEKANIIGRNDIAAIVGTMSGGTMEACYVGNSYIEGNDHVASLAGKIYGGAVIHDCYSNATIFSRSTQAGGLGGVILDANSKVSKCYFSGKVTIPTSSTRPGGIVALIDNNNGITIEYCVNLASSIIGGSNCRIIQNGSQSTYTLTSNYSISSTIMNPNGSVMSPTDSNVATNKLHGANLPSDADALSSTFYSTTQGWDFTNTWAMLPTGGYPVLKWQTSPQDVTVFSTKDGALISTGSVDLNKLVVTNNAKNAITFTPSSSNVTIDANNVLTMNSAVSSVETVIINIAAKPDFTLASGSPTSFTISLVPDAADPIEISTVADLAIVEAFPAKNYKLMADLDMTGVTFDGLCSVDNPFTGIFDGNGHVISNVTNTKWAAQKAKVKGTGLFNATKGATIKKLGVEAALITGIDQNVGAIIGQMQGGLIEECYVVNSQINGYDHVGSLVGGVNDYNNDKTGTGATVRNCYGNANVYSTNYQAGGLTGTVMKGVVEKCYFTGMVKNTGDRAVGLAGYHDNSTTTTTTDVIVRNNINLATSILSQNQYPAQTFRIFDHNGRSCTLTNNYSISNTLIGKADLSSSGVATVELTTTGRNGANLTSDADAKKRMFYINTLSWDFDDVWTIKEGAEYPQLMVFKPIATIVSNADALIGDVTTGNGSGEYSQANKDVFVAARNAASDDDDRDALNAAQSDFLASVNQTFTGTGTWSATDNWSAGFLPANTANVFVSNGELTIDVNVTAAKLTIAPAAKVSLNNGVTLSTATVTLQSSPSGTATFVDKRSHETTTAINATVEQYLPSGRNWYVSIPVANAGETILANSLITAGASSVSYWNESTGAWVNNYSGPLTPGKGYIAIKNAVPSTNNASFSGNLNTGNFPVTVTRTVTAATKPGFNLIANPYPSYLNPCALITGKSKLEPTIWYRTAVWSTPLNKYIYSFQTVTTADGVGTGGVTGYIPPMQAFWVRVLPNANPAINNSEELIFTNDMRYHGNPTVIVNETPTTIPTTALKAPQQASSKKIIRLQVSNGAISDEAILYTNANASNSFDRFDSRKMSNDNVSIPEIYTIVDGEQLVINGFNQLPVDRELMLGFKTGQSGDFTLKASELTNLDAGVSLVLRDKLTNAEWTLNPGESYSFSSGVINTTNRFSLIFKTVGVTTDITNKTVSSSLLVYSTQNGKITVQSNFNNVKVFNALGQQVYEQKLNSDKTELNCSFTSGVYTIVAGGETRKIIVNGK